jgi:hypothetical protein
MCSFNDLMAFTCKKMTSDSRRVTSAFPVAVLNLTDATCIPDMEWKKTTIFLMWVRMAALPQSRNDGSAYPDAKEIFTYLQHWYALTLKVPKRENFLLAFFASSEPIWVCDVGTAKKI